jgi:hypothetical protein
MRLLTSFGAPRHRRGEPGVSARLVVSLSENLRGRLRLAAPFSGQG